MGTTTTAAPLHANPHVAAVLAYAASGKGGTGSYTPNQWVQGAARAGYLPAACTNTSAGVGKAVGRNLRGVVGRTPGCGVGRGNTYPPTTARQLLQLAGHSGKVATASKAGNAQAQQQASGSARSVWQAAAAAKAKAAGHAAARQAKRQANAKPAQQPAQQGTPAA